MFLNKFGKLLLDMVGKLSCCLFGSKRERVPSRFTEEYLAEILQDFPVTFPIPEADQNYSPCPSYDMDGDPPAILPKGYTRVRKGMRTYTFLKCCYICGKFGDHLAEDCTMKPCDSEYFRRHFMTSASEAEHFSSQESLEDL